MKKNDGDQILRQKMEELGTLDGGIVFGREEAWDKLQSRMDKKPALVMPIKIRMAAAAVLMIMAGATAVYYSSDFRLVKTGNSGPGRHDIKNISGMETGKKEAATELTRVNIDKPNKVTSPAIVHYSAPTEKLQNKPNSPAWTVNDSVIATVPISLPSPVAKLQMPATKEMKVVYIDDVEHSRTEKKQPVSDINAPVVKLDLNAMPVNYIGDVERNEAEFRTMLRDNPRTLVRNIFARPIYQEEDYSPQEYTQSHKFMKGIFNNQN